MFQKAGKFVNLCQGQSLIEVLVALTVTAIMLLALVNMVLMGLKNSQFAQNQVLATKYAQETMERIKSIRDRDGEVDFINLPTTGNCADTDHICKFSDLWSYFLSDQSLSPCTITEGVGQVDGCYFNLSNDQLKLEEPSISQAISQVLEDKNFSREIFFEDNPAALQEKKITVKVKWQDNSGEHQSFLQTVLTER